MLQLAQSLWLLIVSLIASFPQWARPSTKVWDQAMYLTAV